MIDRMFEDDHFIMLLIDVDQADDVLHELLEPLRSPDIAADIPPQGSGNPLTEYIAYIELLKDAASGARFVAERIISWRQKRRQQGQEVRVRIIRPGKAPINLVFATDEEVTVRITDGRERK
jgi:hypothetical protein